MFATAILPPSSALPPAPVVQLRDEIFDPARLGVYHLDILLTEGHCRLAVREAARQKVVVFEDWTLAEPAALPALAASHELLGRQGWAGVRLALGGGAFTLLPAPLFRPGDEAAYLQLHHALGATEQAWAYALPPGSPAHELVSLFAAEAAVAEWLHTTHGLGARLLHHTSALVAGLQIGRAHV